uniref:Uncharacterized protein n=1 Tax=Strigamia maritima TaxID=126957 RepID=T1JBA3_STRMM
MAICGPKLSICCSIISVWGIVQLVIMGGLFWAKSAALVDDIPEFEIESPEGDKYDEWHKKYFEKMEAAYDSNASNCWICAGLYVVSLLFSLSQLYLHKRRQS